METYNFTTQIQTAEQFKALKAFMKALEIKFKASKVENNAILTQEQKDAIDEGLNELDQGKGIPHKTVMTEMYPIPEWQMKEVNRRMEEYYKNPEIAEDFDTAMDEIEKDL